MTARQCYEAILIELNKENAPNILLEDFNYLFNKAINQYINKRYNIYDISQQTTDDLRVLKATALLTPAKCEEYGPQSEIGRMMGATYEVNMPADYLHILNCICIYDVKKTFKCYNKGDVWRRAATRLTADVYSQILDNFWLRPTYLRPYYYIHNVNEYNQSINSSIPNTPTNRYRRPHYANSVKDSQYIQSTENNTTTYYPELKETYTYDPQYTSNGKYTKTVDTYLYQKSGQTVYTLQALQEQYGDDVVTSTNISVIEDGEAQAYEQFKISYTYNLFAPQIGTDATISYQDEINTTDHLSPLGQDYHNNNIAVGKDYPTSIPITTTFENGYESGGISNVERGAGIRYGNISNVRMEIRYGTDDSLFHLKKVYIDYIKAPQNIRLTQEQLDLTEDTSQMLEFPDYVCQEIINELVHIVMENITDQRLQTHPVVSQSIANPAQAQAPEAAGQTA